MFVYITLAQSLRILPFIQVASVVVKVISLGLVWRVSAVVPQILFLALLEVAVALLGIYCSVSFSEQLRWFVQVTNLNFIPYKCSSNNFSLTINKI